MNQENENQVDETEELSDEELKSQKENEISDKLTQIGDKLEGSQALARMVGNPQIRAILEAQQEGREVKIVDVAEEAKQQPEVEDFDPSLDLDELTNKELLEHVVSKVSKVVGKIVEEKVTVFDDKLSQISTVVQSGVKERVDVEIEKVRKDYPDFDNYRELMVNLNKQNPGLTVKELYFTAKGRSVDQVTNAPGLSSERPTGSSSKPPKKSIKGGVGKGNFESSIREAISRAELDVDLTKQRRSG